MANHFNKGFTLIELLVVIAIIGVLSSVVLASLNTARGKAADSAAKSNLANMRAQAELVYNDAPGSYANVCTNPNVVSAVKSAASAEGLTAWTAVADNTTARGCYSLAGSWVAWVNLAKGAGGANYWCVDYNGTSIQKTLAPANATPTTCATTAGAAW